MRHLAPGLHSAILTTTVAALLCAASAHAQPVAPAAGCPGPADIQPAHLYGLWQISLWPEGGREDAPTSRGALLFEKHPEYTGSVRGDLRRTAAGQDLLAQVSGDVTDGVFNLDESDDGRRMSAVWVGEPDDCGHSLRGTRRPAEGHPTAEPTLHFHLRKLPGWQ